MSGPSPVTGGTPEPGLPAVVALVDADDATGCTATLIAEHTLLTAAHCVAGRDVRTLRACFGSDVADCDTFVALADARVDPDFDPTTLDHDLAVITIRDPAPTAPLALDARTIDASFVGATFEVVGFGHTAPDATDLGVKRSGTAQVSEVAATTLTIVPAPSQPCTGDSGGPALFDDGGATVVTGVVSHGDAACAVFAIYGRVDVATFIAPYVAETAPGTAATGDACFYDGHCADGACLQAADDALLWFCSEACTGDGDCPDAMACVDDQCVYPLPSPGALGSTCDGDDACTSDLCHDGACSRSCLSQDCPAGFACAHEGGLDYFCVAEPPPGCCSTGGRGDVTAIAALIVLALARRIGRSASPRGSRR